MPKAYQCRKCGQRLMTPEDYEAFDRMDPRPDTPCCSEPTGWTDPATAREHLCCVCDQAEFDAAWDADMPCRQCENKPCEHGGDCWWNPPQTHPYETYIACRHSAFPLSRVAGAVSES